MDRHRDLILFIIIKAYPAPKFLIYSTSEFDIRPAVINKLSLMRPAFHQKATDSHYSITQDLPDKYLVGLRTMTVARG